MTVPWPHTKTPVVFDRHADIYYLPCLSQTVYNETIDRDFVAPIEFCACLAQLPTICRHLLRKDSKAPIRRKVQIRGCHFNLFIPNSPMSFQGKLCFSSLFWLCFSPKYGRHGSPADGFGVLGHAANISLTTTRT